MNTIALTLTLTLALLRTFVPHSHSHFSISILIPSVVLLPRWLPQLGSASLATHMPNVLDQSRACATKIRLLSRSLLRSSCSSSLSSTLTFTSPPPPHRLFTLVLSLSPLVVVCSLVASFSSPAAPSLFSLFVGCCWYPRLLLPLSCCVVLSLSSLSPACSHSFCRLYPSLGSFLPSPSFVLASVHSPH